MIERVEYYQSAKAALIDAGFASEMRWQASRVPDYNPVEFLREAAWVIINSGFRESVARRLFRGLSLCFCDWEPQEIVEARGSCLRSAAMLFRHPKKLGAIACIAQRLAEDWPVLRAQIDVDAIGALSQLPFIGPVTAFHLAKNLGYPCAKADRHLVRLAQSFGECCVQTFCGQIADATGDPVALVDLVLWRYSVERQSLLTS